MKAYSETRVHRSERRLKQARTASDGFTLVELMVTLAVLGVLASLAMPSLQDMSRNSRLRSYTTELAASVHLARSEAIKRNTVVELCVSSDGASCGTGNWQQGWVVLAGSTVLHAQGELDSAYAVSGTKEGVATAITSLKFQPSGVGLKLNSETDTGAAVFRVCKITSSTSGSPERELRIGPTGRTSVEKRVGGACSAS